MHPPSSSRTAPCVEPMDRNGHMSSDPRSPLCERHLPFRKLPAGGAQSRTQDIVLLTPRFSSPPMRNSNSSTDSTARNRHSTTPRVSPTLVTEAPVCIGDNLGKNTTHKRHSGFQLSMRSCQLPVTVDVIRDTTRLLQAPTDFVSLETDESLCHRSPPTLESDAETIFDEVPLAPRPTKRIKYMDLEKPFPSSILFPIF